MHETKGHGMWNISFEYQVSKMIPELLVAFVHPYSSFCKNKFIFFYYHIIIFSPLFYFELLCWEFIVAFIKVVTIYQIFHT
jgi:hypothetical protein